MQLPDIPFCSRLAASDFFTLGLQAEPADKAVFLHLPDIASFLFSFDGVGIFYKFIADRGATLLNGLKFNVNEGRHDICYGQYAVLWECRYRARIGPI